MLVAVGVSGIAPRRVEPVISESIIRLAELLGPGDPHTHIPAQSARLEVRLNEACVDLLTHIVDKISLRMLHGGGAGGVVVGQGGRGKDRPGEIGVVDTLGNAPRGGPTEK